MDCMEQLAMCSTQITCLASKLATVETLICAAQFACFYWATLGCSASKLEGYTYPGGGKNASFNLMPAIHLLAERPPLWYGSAFEVIPSNEASTVAGAPVGTWWQTPGPIFPIYTYEDVANSQTTVYMRRKLLRLGQSHVIQRCDGKGPVVHFSEGWSFFSNRLRKWLKMNQAMSYKIYVDDALVAVAEETQQGFQSITFRGVQEENKGRELASSVLQSRHFHGKYDVWLVQNKEEDVMLPDYVSSATTLLYAFYTLHQDKRDVSSVAKDKAHTVPNFLAEVDKTNVSEHLTAPLEMPVETEVKVAEVEMAQPPKFV